MNRTAFSATCPSCGKQGMLRAAPGGQGVECVACRRAGSAVFFPALLPKPPPMPPGLADQPGEGDNVCFYSPQRKATATCEQCGVFISDAWKAKWGSKVLCLRCLDKMHAEGRGIQFETSRTLWDNIVLLLALLPLTFLFWWVAFITAPAAFILGLWAWNKPSSIVPRSKARLVIALILSALEMIGVAWFIYFVASNA